MNKIDSKVLIIGNAVSGGGAEKSMLELHRTLLNSGVSSFYYAFNGFVPADLAHLPKNVIKGSRQNKAGFYSTLKEIFLLKTYMKILRPTHIILNCELSELASVFFSRRYKKVFVVEHTTRPWRSHRQLGALVRLYIKLKKYIWVTVNSSREKIWFGTPKPIYIPNPIIRSKIAKGTMSKFGLVFVGRLEKNKQPESFIRICLQANLEGHIFGDGPMLNFLRSKYIGLNLNFYGYKENPFSTISENNIFVCTSEFEGDGLAIVEAVINQFPVFLLDNADLRRFNFPNINYFIDENDAVKKLKKYSDESPSILSIQEGERRNLESRRDPRVICSLWLSLLLD
jgi:glycosyltransferase involved in cell wall biosynthesis